MSRLFADGSPIQVRLSDKHQPAYFTWQGHAYQIGQVTNHWRINIAWWGQHQHRDYYKLTMTNGWLVEIFCDRLTSEWYLQRVYD